VTITRQAVSAGRAPEVVRVELDGAALRELDARLGAARIPPDPAQGWEAGTPRRWLAELVDDWRAFDPRRLQARLDQLTHRILEIHGMAVHFVHARGDGDAPVPLLLTHGWPSSFLEYLDLLPLLTDPAAHGGAVEDAFAVVAPSPPGFGFSGPPPPGGLTPDRVAELWHEIMGALGSDPHPRHTSARNRTQKPTNTPARHP
jgi:hypothetical protein